MNVIQWGLGAMGSLMAALVAERPGLRLLGAIDNAPDRAGRDLGEMLEVAHYSGLRIADRPGTLKEWEAADVVLHAVTSFAPVAAPHILHAVERGCNVITIAEEMAYPWAQHSTLAKELDSAAKAAGVTILGTGVNPGFVLDTLIVALTGACANVQSVYARRVNDLSPFGPTVLRTQGVGCTPSEFEKGLGDGSIVGHVGFPESLGLIGKRLGWAFDEVRQQRAPIVSELRRETAHLVVEPGQVAGCRHTAQGLIEGRVVVELEHPQQVRPDLAGVETGDFISIKGEPGIQVQIRPEIPGGTATAALAVNMIPAVLTAPPGLLCMVDLPVPSILPSGLVVKQT